MQSSDEVASNVLERKDKSLKRLGNLAMKRFTNKRIIVVVYRAIRGQKCCQIYRGYHKAALKYDLFSSDEEQYFMYERSE